MNGKLMPVAGRQPLFRYEKALSQIPLEACYVWEDEPVPAGTVATLDARQPYVEPAFVSHGGTLPDELKSRLPLVLPAGWSANYSWSEDCRTLLAFLRRPSAAGQEWNTAEGGDYTCVDTTLRIEKDGLVDTWETQCLKPGKIQLRIHRQEGDKLVLVGRSEMVEMAAPGRCRFALKEPIAVRPGDLLGFHIPSEDTEIAARHGGRMLFVEGSAAGSSAVAGWQTEAKIADLAAFCKAEPARPQPSAPRAGVDLVLQNFPAETLAVQLIDLAARRSVLQTDFRQTTSLAGFPHGDHLFLLVLPSGRRANVPTGEGRGQ